MDHPDLAIPAVDHLGEQLLAQLAVTFAQLAVKLTFEGVPRRLSASNLPKIGAGQLSTCRSLGSSALHEGATFCKLGAS